MIDWPAAPPACSSCQHVFVANELIHRRRYDSLLGATYVALCGECSAAMPHGCMAELALRHILERRALERAAPGGNA